MTIHETGATPCSDSREEDTQFSCHDGVYIPATPLQHREDEYEERWFDTLLTMEQRHFWYRGRYRFIYHEFKRQIFRSGRARESLRIVDIGGGVGGWIDYLRNRSGGGFGEMALADSSLRALRLSAPVVGDETTRFQVDVCDLPWTSRWDVIFLLDVIEHIPDDAGALRQIARALRPNGLLFVTAPALKFFWSHNDDLDRHQRRYSRKDFAELSRSVGLRLRSSRYFMFFLSPLLWISRLRGPRIGSMSPEQVRATHEQAHRVPSLILNQALRVVFSMETPVGHQLPFPWGTSILGVFEKLE